MQSWQQRHLAARKRRRRREKRSCVSVGHRWSYLQRPIAGERDLDFRYCERCGVVEWETGGGKR